MKIRQRTTADSKQNLISRVELTPVAHLVKRLILRPSSIRGYSIGMLFGTLILLLHECGIMTEKHRL